MKPFLQEVVDNIIKNYGKNYSHLCFVFQNKRAALFFRHYFAKSIGNTAWAPDVFPIDKLTGKLSGLTLADETGLIFDLYEIYNNLYFKQYKKNITFDDFYTLGQTILSDFNDIDANLVDTNTLFSNISDLEANENAEDKLTAEQVDTLRNFWEHFNPENNSTEKEKFAVLWKTLPLLYKQFTENLLQRRIAYRGLQYREVINLLNRREVRFPNYEVYVFVGFNALNKSEQKLFSYLKSINKALFYWDSDVYYQDSLKQEAGLFLRSNIKYLSEGVLPPFDGFNTNSKKIEVVGVPLNVGQAQLIPVLLNKMKGKIGDYSKETAVVLPDESMLLPVLQFIPSEIEKVNVSMGYPFSATNLYGFIDLFFNIQTKFSTNQNNENEYYVKDVVPLLTHPEVWYKAGNEVKELLEKIENENIVYINEKALTRSGSRIIEQAFTKYTQTSDLLIALLAILYELYMSGKEPEQDIENSIEDELIYQAYIAVKRIKEVFDSKQFTPEIITTIRILKQVFGQMNVPFSGEPLEGLQILGLLETRNLDFKNLIILSANEGILPKPYNSTSLISQFLRHSFGMQTIEKADALSAYLFYRLLQRAENIYLVYNNITGYNSSRELSRYVQQLQYESGIKIKLNQLKQNIVPAQAHTIYVEKNQYIMRQLNTYLVPANLVNPNHRTQKSKRRFSASAINTYIDCSLKFYYRYIARIKEKISYSDEINPLQFGNLLHRAIELVYNEFIEVSGRKTIQKTDFNTLNEIVEKNIDKAFVDVLMQSENENFELKGNQLIIRDVIKKYTRSILATDKKHAPFSIVSLEVEKDYSSLVPFEVAGTEKFAAFSATIDRVDMKENQIRIVDYKTGSTNHSYSSAEDLFDRNKTNRRKAIFQLLLYSKLYSDNSQENNAVYPAIFSVRDLNNQDFDPLLYHRDKRLKTPITGLNCNLHIKEMLNGLSDVLAELYDMDIPFEQTENNDTCNYCPYRKICSR